MSRAGAPPDTVRIDVASPDRTAADHLRTKREAVDFALRRALRRQVTHEQLAGLEGIGFGATLSEIRPADAERHR